MDDKLTQQIIEILSGTKEFVVAQAPDVVQQYIQWTAVLSLLQAVFCLALLAVSLKLAYAGVAAFNKFERESDEKFAAAIFTVFCLAAGVISVGVGLGKIETFVYAKYFPKAYMLSLVTKK